MKEDEQSQVDKDLEPEAAREGAAAQKQDMELTASKMVAAELDRENIYAENLGDSVPKVELVGSFKRIWRNIWWYWHAFLQET